VAAEVDVGRLAQADVILHDREAIAPQEQPVGQGSHADTDQAGDTPQEEEQRLLQDITAHAGGLTRQVVP
jgi:hypothetical protein